MKSLLLNVVSAVMVLTSYGAFGANHPYLNVTFDLDSYKAGDDATVTIRLADRSMPPGKDSFVLPPGSSDATARYTACWGQNLTVKPTTIGSENFCEIVENEKVFSSNTEPVPEFLSGANAGHAFSQALKLPPLSGVADRNIWVVTNATYAFSGLPQDQRRSLDGFSPLYYRCSSTKHGPADVPACTYYTAKGYKDYLHAKQVAKPAN